MVFVHRSYDISRCLRISRPVIRIVYKVFSNLYSLKRSATVISPLSITVLRVRGAAIDTSAPVNFSCRLCIRSVNAEEPKKQSAERSVVSVRPILRCDHAATSSAAAAKWLIYASSTGMLRISAISPFMSHPTTRRRFFCIVTVTFDRYFA